MSNEIKAKEFQGQDGVLVTDKDGDGAVNPGADEFEKLTVDEGIRGVKDDPRDQTRPAMQDEVLGALESFRAARQKIDAIADDVSAMRRALSDPTTGTAPTKTSLGTLAGRLKDIAGTPQRPSGASPHLRSRGNVERGKIEGMNVELTSFVPIFGDIEGGILHAKALYRAFVTATREDPDNPDAWFGRGLVTLRAGLLPDFAREKVADFLEKDYQVDLDQDLVAIMEKLDEFPEDTKAQSLLEVMLTTLLDDERVDIPATLGDAMDAILDRASRLRRENPEAAAEADAAIEAAGAK
jgi:hypothetical protein